MREARKSLGQQKYLTMKKEFNIEKKSKRI